MNEWMDEKVNRWVDEPNEWMSEWMRKSDD